MAALSSSSDDCLSNLLCGEDASNVVGCWDEGDDDERICGQGVDKTKSRTKPIFPDFPVQDDEEIAVLVGKECEYMPLKWYQDHRMDFASARANAIGWILKVHAYYSFGPLTAYLSINYLDRFLSRYQLPDGKAWMLQLLSVACLSLAAKMEETDVPLLLDLQTEGPKFVFEARTLKRMELMVLATLEWRMLSVTPFSFIDYFIHHGGNDGGGSSSKSPMVSRVGELILSTIRGIDFLQHRPSAIAAAAVLCAAEESLAPAEGARYRKGVLSCSTVNKDLILKCYSLMRRLFAIPKRAKSASSSIPQSPVGVLDGFCTSNSTTSRASSLEESLRSVNLYASVAAKRRKLNGYCNTSTLQPNLCT
ncbi:hypothetical protein SUGI_0249120 [Cryptomeria japonica]|uniref:cyclin-D4-1 n=1 Tax=Cryptomeria japonica TaxID=3369 RepID=UPI002408EA93|nr:cyclin-D4-1 [Cryptomeria japonica]GLJ15237.1 hypothetical protein SUGI_0249120 [Cryptomeria japonica]